MQFRERHLQLVWGLRLFRQEGLRTEDARSLAIEFPGLPSVEGGPDFRGARLRIGGVPATGDVELHLTTDGWREHGHARRGAYESVILHVALERGRAPGPAPELVLAPYLDRSLADLARELEPGGAPSARPGDLDRLGDARFDRRVERFRRLLAGAPVAQVFWREVLIALGYKENQAPFEELSRLAPLRSLRGLDAGGIEERLRAAAARLRWRLRGVRPGNRPDRRISGAARWLAAAGADAPQVSHFERVDATFDPDGTGQIGDARAAEIRANVVLPMAVAAGSAAQAARAREAFASLPPCGANRRTRDARALFGIGAPATLRREWGMMEALSRFVLAPPRGAC